MLVFCIVVGSISVLPLLVAYPPAARNYTAYIDEVLKVSGRIVLCTMHPPPSSCTVMQMFQIMYDGLSALAMSS